MRHNGSIVYYDGQTNDSRMNCELALTAAAAGARLFNHVEVTSLLKDDSGRVCGVRARDVLREQEFEVRARVVINATGPAADELRLMEDASATRLMRPSAGSHLVLPPHYSASSTGLLIPKTRDGRILFMLPWEGSTVVGTTERKVTPEEAASVYGVGIDTKEVEFICDALKPYLSIDVSTDDVRAAWTGVRPLALDPESAASAGGTDTAKLSRDHVVNVGPGGMVSIMGGKWTTWRLMAEDTVDAAVAVGHLQDRAGPCITAGANMLGSRGYHQALFIELLRNYRRERGAGGSVVPLDERIARHLAHTYGSKSREVAYLASHGYGKRLVRGLPFLEGAPPPLWWCTDRPVDSLRIVQPRLCMRAAMRARARSAMLFRAACRSRCSTLKPRRLPLTAWSS